MAKLKNRKIACIITIFIIILSTIVNGSRTLLKLRSEVENKYTNGVADDGSGISSNLDGRIAAANNMITVSNRWIEGDQAVKDAATARDQLIAAKTPGEQYAANIELSSAITALYDKLGQVEMDERDTKYRQSLYVDLNSYNTVIDLAAEEYNQEAMNYNSNLKKFPANLISTITNIKKIELYQ